MDFQKIRTDFGGKIADFLKLVCYENVQPNKKTIEVGSVLLCRGKIFLLTSFRACLNLEQGCTLYWYSVLEITDTGIKSLPAHEFNDTEIADYQVIGVIDVSKIACLNNIAKPAESKNGYEVERNETNVLSVETHA